MDPPGVYIVSQQQEPDLWTEPERLMGRPGRFAARLGHQLGVAQRRRLFSAAASAGSTGGRSVPDAVDTLVVGGGIIGACAAWRLAVLGHRVLVLEQNTLTSGTTWHAAGLVSTVKGHEAMVSMVKYTRDLYIDSVDKDTGISSVGWAQTGSLGLARTPDMWTQLQRATALLEEYDVCHTLYGPDAHLPLSEAQDIHPLLNLEEDGVLGALHTPHDGIVNPSDACMHFVQLARHAGVQFIENCGVAELETQTLSDGSLSVTGVRTVHDDRIGCDSALLACGQWTRQLAASVGVNIPVAIVPHQYTVFDRLLDECGNTVVNNTLPVVRDYENKIYIKPEVGGLMVGAFEGPHALMPETVAKRNRGEIDVPADASHELYTGTTEKMEDGLMSAMSLVPSLEQTGIKQMVHGPDTHSVDHEPVLGRAPETDNLWVATGFNSLGIQLGPGVGHALSEWIHNGEPGGSLAADFAELDVRRFHPAHTCASQWCTSRALEGYAREYGVHYPTEEFSRDELARGVRLSPVHDLVANAGAIFGAVGLSGFERPLHFARSQRQKQPEDKDDLKFYTEEKLSFDATQTGWWEAVKDEHTAARNGAVLFDLSSFGKLHISGTGAAAAMEWCASSEVGTANLGKVLYTQMLNERGGVESDLTIMPLDNHASEDDDTGTERAFYAVTSSATCTRDKDHIMRSARQRGIEDVRIKEITDDWAVLALMGPESRSLMRTVFPTVDFSNDAFPFGTAQELAAVQHCDEPIVRALRVSFVGELGWEMHCPAAVAPALWQALHEAGIKTGANSGKGLVNAGYRALLVSLRLEKKFVHFGHDISPTDSQLDAGLGFVSASKLKSSTPFLGREALLEQKRVGFTRRLVSFKAVDSSRVSWWGGEPIYCNGERVGKLTSGGIGYTVNHGGAIGIGYVTPPSAVQAGGLPLKELRALVMGGEYEIGVGSQRVKAKVAWDALYDPRAEKMRDAPAI